MRVTCPGGQLSTQVAGLAGKKHAKLRLGKAPDSSDQVPGEYLDRCAGAHFFFFSPLASQTGTRVRWSLLPLR